MKNRGRKWAAEVPFDSPMAEGLYRCGESRYVPVANFYARGYEKASAVAAELFGEDALVVEFDLPSGYRAKEMYGEFFTKDSRYGAKYMCSVCRREHLGLGERRRMHWPGCPLRPGD